MNEHLSDEELIRELVRWGEGDNSIVSYSALEIQRKSHVKSRSTLRLTLATAALMAAATMFTAWYANLRIHDVTPREFATESATNAPDAERLLKSIALRTQNIGNRINDLNLRWEQQHQLDIEIHELHARLLNTKRVAIRNQIALNQKPVVTQ